MSLDTYSGENHDTPIKEKLKDGQINTLTNKKDPEIFAPLKEILNMKKSIEDLRNSEFFKETERIYDSFAELLSDPEEGNYQIIEKKLTDPDYLITLKKTREEFTKPGQPITTSHGEHHTSLQPGKDLLTLSDYYEPHPNNPYLFYQAETHFHALNTKFPKILYNKNIPPMGILLLQNYSNKGAIGDIIEIPYYTTQQEHVLKEVCKKRSIELHRELNTLPADKLIVKKERVDGKVQNVEYFVEQGDKRLKLTPNEYNNYYNWSRSMMDAGNSYHPISGSIIKDLSYNAFLNTQNNDNLIADNSPK